MNTHSQDINQPITKDEFMYQLKHVVPTNQRKQWAEQNKHRIVKSPIQTAYENWYSNETIFNRLGFWGGKDINGLDTPNLEDAFNAGYKQAIKDLGYDK